METKKLELELKHITPYLPYKLKCMLTFDMRDDFAEEDWVTDNEVFNKGAIWTYAGYCDDDLCIPLGDGDFSGLLIRNDKCYISVGKAAKPILRPISKYHLNIAGGKVMDILGCTIDQVHELWDLASGDKKLNDITLGLYDVMNKKHIDYNNLIDQGLAVNINTIK